MKKAYSLKNEILPFQKNLPNVKIDELVNKYLDFTDHKLILFDLETLGLNPAFDYEQITELSAWVVNGNNFDIEKKINYKIELNESAKTLLNDSLSLERENWMDRQSKRRNSNFSDPNEILEMTHYNDLKLSEVKESFAINKFIDLVNEYENVILVAHNAKFDVRFMTIRSSKYDQKLPVTKTLDTLKLARYFFAPLVQKLSNQDDIKEIYDSLFRQRRDFVHISSKLGEIANALNINSEDWHSADADVYMMYEILKYMLMFFEKHKNEDIKSYQLKVLKRNVGKYKST